MTAFDLPTQIQVARRWHDRERTGQTEAIVHTLEWLHENETRIKAKCEEPPEILPTTKSAREYRPGQAIFIDLAKGGWERHYEVLDDCGRVIGTKIEGAETRHSKPYVMYVPAGFRTFKTFDAFVAAYEAGEFVAREAKAA